MEAKRLRVLVVDDHASWRRLVCLTIGRQRHLCVVGEAADGLEAIQKVQELLPDLILLDISLPKLNGLEVARQIQDISPRSKVLIVSENRSVDVAEVAFRRGAVGYVVKSAAATELLLAVDAVLDGNEFISTHLTDSGFVKSRSSEAAHSEDAITPSPLRNAEHTPRHEVEFYPEDAAYIAGLNRCIQAALRQGDPVIVIAIEPHRASLQESLERDGVDVIPMLENGRVLMLDSFETLSAVMAGDTPDPIRCQRTVSDLIANSAGNAFGMRPRVTICGQCAPVLLSQGNPEGALQLEHLWDKISLANGADTLCGYIWPSIPEKDRRNVVQRICAEHSRVSGLESSH